MTDGAVNRSDWPVGNGPDPAVPGRDLPLGDAFQRHGAADFSSCP